METEGRVGAHTPGTPWLYDEHLHLFVDDAELQGVSGAGRVLERPLSHPANPVLRPDRPWETDQCIIWGSVLRDGSSGRFRMWYMGLSSRGYLPCYAESADGIYWEKPNLGIYEVDGSFIPFHGGTSERRFGCHRAQTEPSSAVGE